MSNPVVVFSMPDPGGRRSGIERRRFSYSGYIPERRREDRRETPSRRNGTERRCSLDRRSGLDRRDMKAQVVVDLEDFRRVKDRRNQSGRRSGIDRRDFMFA